MHSVKRLTRRAAEDASRNWLLCLVLGAAPGLAMAADEADPKPSPTFFRATANARFNFLELLRRPETGAIHLAPSAASQPRSASNGTPRILGLTRASLDLQMGIPRAVDLAITLRPDAPQHEHEFETSAGVPSRRPPTVQLLDGYLLSVRRGSQFQFGLGVISSLGEPDAEDQRVVRFGMTVRVPEKVAVTMVRWSLFDATPPPVSSEFARLIFTLAAYQGRDDRGELIAESTETKDAGPAARDPYVGVAVGAKWRGLGKFLAVNVGTDTAPAELDPQAHINEVWVQGASLFVFDGNGTSLGTDCRYAQQQFSDGMTLAGAVPVEEMSFTLSGRYGFGSRRWAVAAGHFGRGELLRPVDLDAPARTLGFQFEGGYAAEVWDGLMLRIVGAQEQRTTEEAGVQVGGIAAADGDRMHMLTRFGVEVDYLVGGDL